VEGNFCRHSWDVAFFTLSLSVRGTVFDCTMWFLHVSSLILFSDDFMSSSFFSEAYYTNSARCKRWGF